MKGFTLIELIAVILILGIIAVITTVSVNNSYVKSKESLYDTQLEIIDSATKKWIVANSGYLPSDGSKYNLELSKLVADGYLDDGDVIDPRTKETFDGYVEIYFDESVNQYKSKLIDNTKKGLTSETILKNASIVTSGTGLYADSENSGRYYYKGTNPNNYFKFNGSVWRIVSIEEDGSLKIIKQDSIGNYVFDSAGVRSSSNGNYACISSNGCPIWAKNQDNVVTNSELYEYLNKTYYNTLNKTSKDSIINSKWCYDYLTVGSGSSSADFNEDQLYSFCTSEYVSSKVGLINVKEIIDASNGTCGFKKACQNNYLNNSTNYWTLNYSADVLIFNSSGQVSSSSASGQNAVRPAVVLSPDLEIKGKGTSSSPFQVAS